MNEDKQSIREIWDIIKCTNMCMMAVLEKKERENRTEKIFKELIFEDFLNLRKNTNLHISEL